MRRKDFYSGQFRREHTAIQCNNCNAVGHVANRCNMPVTSFGIIAYYKPPEGPIKYLMGCRRQTFGYLSIIQGHYHSKNMQYMVDEMTDAEKQKILESNLSNTMNACIYKSTTQWDTPEWEFPKGRRNSTREKPIECALREFEEETGYPVHQLRLVANVTPFEETFIGSDNRAYCYKYFIARMTCDPTSSQQLSRYQRAEISQIAWKTANECAESTRPYNLEKRHVIKRIHDLMTHHPYLYITE